MLAVITGGVTNIVLDWVFIFPLGWGMAGAALASVIGVILTCLILCTHFFHKENHLSFLTERLRPRYVKEIFQYGFSSFFMEISTGIVIFVFNLQLLHYAGELGVTVYSILSNSAYMIIALSNGIAQAAQPFKLLPTLAQKIMPVSSQIKKYGLFTAAVEGGIFCPVRFTVPIGCCLYFHQPDRTDFANGTTGCTAVFLIFPGHVAEYFLYQLLPGHPAAIQSIDRLCIARTGAVRHPGLSAAAGS